MRSWAAIARRRVAWIRTSPVWKHSDRPPRAERTTSASSLAARNDRDRGDAIRRARAAAVPSAGAIGAAISIASRALSRSRRAPRAALPASAAAPVAMTAAQSQNPPRAGSSLPATALAQASTSSTHASSQRAASASSVQASRSRVGTVLLMAPR